MIAVLPSGEGKTGGPTPNGDDDLQFWIVFFYFHFMKKLNNYLFFFVLGFVLTTVTISCKKKKDTEFNYAVNNVGDVSINSKEPKAVSYEVKLLSGNQQTVALELSGLPAGITVDLTPSSGIASFYAVASYSVNSSVSPGMYPFVLKAKTAGLADKEFKANVIVNTGSECGKDYVGMMEAKEECSVGKDEYLCTIELDASIKNRIRINNFYNGAASITVYADLDCANDRIIVPRQETAGYTISGSGKLVAGSGSLIAPGFDLTYTISGPVSNTCTTYFRK